MKFKVKVISSNKEKKEIEVDAIDRTTAISNLRSQGFLILEMEEKPSISKHGSENDNSWTSEEIARADERQREVNEEIELKKNIAQSKKAKISKPDINLQDSKKSELQFNPQKKTNIPILKAKGKSGQIELYGNKICICRRGISGFLLHGSKGDKEIMISSITAIQFKKANMWVNGYIQIAFMGGMEAKKGIFEAVSDENTVMFDVFQQDDFICIKNEMEKLMLLQNSTSDAYSGAEEIEKLANLRDKGILTEQEFNQKKKQILDL